VIPAGVVFLNSMSTYDLRALFPYKDTEFTTAEGDWICRLAEVSDQRPEADRLSWYLVFEPVRNAHAVTRKLEVVTPAEQSISQGLGTHVKDRIEKWLESGDQDGREEWLDG
jgi:hypothetical protein